MDESEIIEEVMFARKHQLGFFKHLEDGKRLPNADVIKRVADILHAEVKVEAIDGYSSKAYWVVFDDCARYNGASPEDYDGDYTYNPNVKETN